MTLTIAEDVLLLAYQEDTGKPLVSSTELDAALGGAILAELALAGRVDVADRRVAVLDPRPVGHPELDSALARIAGERRARKPEWWVYRLRGGGLRDRLLTALAGYGILHEETVRILGLFPSRRYPERDPRAEWQTRTRIQAVLDGAPADPRTAVLIAILHAAKIDKWAFGHIPKARVRQITEGDWAGHAVSATIASINAAVVAGITAASVAATSASG